MAQIVHVTTLTDPVAVDQPAAPVTALEIGQTANGALLYASSPAGGVVTAYALSGSGSATLVDQQALTDPPSAGGGGADAPEAVVTLNGQIYRVVLDHPDHAVQLFRLNPTGGSDLVATMGAEQGLGLSTPTQLEVLEVAGTAYAIIGGAGSSSLSVLEVTATGELIPRDHVIDDMETRFSRVTSLETLQVDGRSYVIAGGADDGLSLFELLPGGRLVHLDTVADSAEMSLVNVVTLAAQETGNGLQIFAGSEREPGVTQLQVSLGTTGAVQLAWDGGATLTGTAGADLLVGGAGADLLKGGAGADLLLDGGGEDRMQGGAGADLFLLDADGAVDHILDFDPREDVLDLSAWTMLRSMDQIAITQTSDGARLSFGEEVLILHNPEGGAYDPSLLAGLDVLNLSRVHLTMFDGLTPDPVQILFEGSAAGETIHGNAADNTLLGLGGNDVLLGGAGADYLDGGAGTDRAAYWTASAGVMVDLENSQANTGDAAGDVYENIEDLQGTKYRDDLRGDSAVNTLIGAAGSDTLWGRAGNDRLLAGDGNDVLLG
ncbi:calcium-binding protein, partial [Dinoroseobacter sp. S375]